MEPIILWTSIAAISACFASIVALVPILRDWYTKKKYADFLRFLISGYASQLSFLLNLVKKQTETDNRQNEAIWEIGEAIRNYINEIHILSKSEYPAYVFLLYGTSFIRPGIKFSDSALEITEKCIKYFNKNQKMRKAIVLNKEQAKDLQEILDLKLNK